MSRKAFVAVFLTVTAAALGMELWASFDSSPETVPWTDLIRDNVPWPVTAGAILVLIVWLPWHFYDRYRRKNQSRQGD